MAANTTVRSAAKVAIAIAVAISPVAGVSAQEACSASRDPFLNPFSKASAHHRPIGSGALYASSTHPATRVWQKAKHFNVNVGAPWGVHLAATDSSDPLRSVGAQASCDKVHALPASVRLPREGLTIPNVSYNSGCPDDDVVIFDRTTNTSHGLRQYQWNNGKPSAGQHKTWNAMSLGHGTVMGSRPGSTATGVVSQFGLLRGHEINTPGYRIQHALQMVLPRKPGCNIMLSRDIVLPATSRDGSAGTGGNNTGSIPYGGLLALPPSVNINNLGLSEPGRRLAEAIQDYGIYAVDGGGCGAGAMRADQTVNSGVLSQVKRDIPKIYPLIRLVLNNNVLGSAVSGGGSPLAPNCAIDAS